MRSMARTRSSQARTAMVDSSYVTSRTADRNDHDPGCEKHNHCHHHHHHDHDPASDD